MGLLDDAATATQQMLPKEGNLLSFGPTPLVQPPPPVRFQPPQMTYPQPQGSFATVGERKRADSQALFHSTAQLIKAGGDFIQEKKQRALTLDIQNLMEAQQGVQEAQQVLQQDPNNKQAQMGLKRNIAIINTITGDSKKAKALQKAFDINLFGTKGKNKNENQALIDAWKTFHEKQQKGDQTALNPNAQRFMAAQPWRLQTSPEAQAQAAAIKAGLIPKAGEILSAQSKIFESMQRAQTSKDRDNILEESAKLRADATDRRTQALIDNNNARMLGQHAAAMIRYKADIYKADKVADTWDKRLKMENKKLGQNAYYQGLKSKAQALTQTLKTLATDDEKMQSELDKKGSSFWGIKLGAASGPDASRLRDQIMKNGARRQMIMDQLDQMQQQLDLIDPVKQDSMTAEPGSSEENPETFDPNASEDNSDEE